MIISVRLPLDGPPDPGLEPYLLFRDQIRPVLEEKRGALDAMYALAIGRPEIDPVLLTGITMLQFMERLPDRQTIMRFRFDVRWRLALGLSVNADSIDASTLCYFRARLAEHPQAQLVMDAGMDAMRRAGYVGHRRAVRIDSTHVLGQLAELSRLECVRETIRLGLTFLANWGGVTAWEPWYTRYAERNPQHLRQASATHLRTTMEQAGNDLYAILARTHSLGTVVCETEPVQLLRRVFQEQFETDDTGKLAQRKATPSGAVHNPHDPEAQWSKKRNTEWVGYKLQVAETAPEQPRARGEPTEAVITAMVIQPAITSDQNSIPPVLQAHTEVVEEAPQTVFADAGYVNAPALERAEKDGYDLCGPAAAPPHSGTRFGSDSFVVDIPNRTAVCPNGKTSCECDRIAESGRQAVYYYFVWSKSDCCGCPLADQCLSKRKQDPRRTLQVGEKHMLVQQRRQLCRSPEYQRSMQRRNGIEGTQSECVRGYGARRCRYRGLARTSLQMQFIGAACNLRRWANRRCWLARRAV
jgi:IS5 family transposase